MSNKEMTEIIWEDIFGNEVKRDTYDLRTAKEKAADK